MRTVCISPRVAVPLITGPMDSVCHSSQLTKYPKTGLLAYSRNRSKEPPSAACDEVTRQKEVNEQLRLRSVVHTPMADLCSVVPYIGRN